MLPAGAAHRPEVPCIGMDSKEQRPAWNEKARAFYRIGECADQRNRSGKAPQLDEHARLAIARTQLAATEMQLRVESRRFEVAQMQLQVQVERTATAKAQLAVEKARNQGRRLDIELEQQQTAATAAKTAAASTRDASRLVDLDKQAAIAHTKKEAAQLQLDAQAKRAVNTDLDLQLQQRQMARAYVGLQQTRLRNEQDPQVRSSPLTQPSWTSVSSSPMESRSGMSPSSISSAPSCGFSTEDPAEVDMHLDMHADEAEKEAARADKEERLRLRQAALKAEIEQGKQRIAVLLASAQETPKAKRKKAKATRQQEGQVKQETRQNGDVILLQTELKRA